MFFINNINFLFLLTKYQNFVDIFVVDELVDVLILEFKNWA
jgi:hypothetical protein